MSKNIIYNDLCSTCKYALNCIFRRDYTNPIHFCEEFETERPSPLKPIKKNKLKSRDSGNEVDEESTYNLGLCINCENRGICVNSKKEGGIWYCEEYQ